MKSYLSAFLAACALHLAPLALAPSTAFAQPAAAQVLDEVPTAPTVKDKGALKKLLGKHGLSLQWIESKKKGVINVWNDASYLRIQGEQREAATGNYVTVEGWITKVEARQFTMRGRIVTRTAFLAGGQPCAREGDFTFLIKGGRKFWRLQEMQNTCEGGATVDYVDITIAPVK